MSKKIVKVMANGMKFYKVEGVEDKLFMTRDSAKRYVMRLKTTNRIIDEVRQAKYRSFGEL